MITRFAPSPTGPLHLGHAYSAVLAHDLARAHGGIFLIRIDDVDGGRSRPEYVDAALDMLRWLGLDWDGDPLFQSEHLAHYGAALDRLRAMGLVYRCFCTRGDIAASLFAPHGPSGVLYSGICRHLDADESEARAAEESHCWRLDMARALAIAGPLTWHEVGMGCGHGAGMRIADPMTHGDIVLARKDAPASYHLASSVDDAMLGISHVVRGADLVESTDVHRLLQALMGWASPIYHHHALIYGPDGHRLAKRDQAAALALRKDAGADGKALADELRQGKLPIGYSLQKA